MQLDDWQKEVLKTRGNMCLRSGRQVGKSTVVSVKAARFAIENSKRTILVIASVERQAYLLFEKILSYLINHHENMICKGVKRPTKHKINLKNGSVIYSLPTGLTGHGIRGYTIDLLIADEAAFIPEEVWTAVTPMLAVTKGNIWLLSTPHGREGYFYSCFNDENFTAFHVTSEECPRKNQAFLDSEKKRMSKVQYAQEYLGEFIDELQQFFPLKLIERCMTVSRENSRVTPFSKTSADIYLGIDVARQGGDETVLLSLKLNENDKLSMIDMYCTTENKITDTYRDIIKFDKQYDYSKIYIDDGGLGVGVFDMLMEDDNTRYKTIPINNSARPLDKDKTRKKKILKEDLYTNLLRLMEQDKIRLFNDSNIMLSLKSIQYEYTDDKRLKIWGRYSHICEALIRAAWCMKGKSLNLKIHSIKV